MNNLISLLNDYINIDSISFQDNLILTYNKFYIVDLIFKKKFKYIKSELNNVILKLFNTITDIDLDQWIKYKIKYSFNKLSYFDLAMWLLWNNIDFLICEDFIKKEYDYISLIYIPNLNNNIKLCLEILK